MLLCCILTLFHNLFHHFFIRYVTGRACSHLYSQVWAVHNYVETLCNWYVLCINNHGLMTSWCMYDFLYSTILGFFNCIAVPKLCSCYSQQIHRLGISINSYVCNKWKDCQHKKMITFFTATIFWNVFGAKQRITAGRLFLADPEHNSNYTCFNFSSK